MLRQVERRKKKEERTKTEEKMKKTKMKSNICPLSVLSVKGRAGRYYIPYNPKRQACLSKSAH
jgi:hypothetical protein